MSILRYPRRTTPSNAASATFERKPFESSPVQESKVQEVPSRTNSLFDIDDRIRLLVDIDLAARLGEFITKSGTNDSEIMAFGKKLNDICHEEN